MAQSASKSCDICMSGQGRNLCEQCDQLMCENCKTLHLRSKISRNHTFINTHKLQVEVKKFMDLRIDCVKTNLDYIEQGTVKYQSDIHEAISAITEEGNQMKQWIDQKVQALITSLEEKGTANLKALQLKRTDFQNDLEKLQKCQTAFMETQRLADVSKLLTQLKHVKSELGIAVEKQLPVMSTVKYYKKDVSEKEISILFGELSFRSLISDHSQTRNFSDTNVTIVGKKDFLKTTLQVGQYMDDFTCAKTVDI